MTEKRKTVKIPCIPGTEVNFKCVVEGGMPVLKEIEIIEPVSEKNAGTTLADVMLRRNGTGK